MHHHLNSLNREVSKHYDSYFEPFGLATSYIELLLLVLEEGTVSQKELSDRMNLAPSTITRFITKLKKEKYIKKGKKGRLVTIEILPGAMSDVKKMKERYQQADDDLKKMLGDKFVETTNRLLQHGLDQLSNKD